MRANGTNSSDVDDDEETLKVVRMVCEVWISLPVALAGIVGNATSLVVLLRQRQSPATNSLLKTIAVTDVLILGTGLVLRSMRYLDLPSYDHFLSDSFPWMNPLAYFLRVFSVWMTVLLTYERFTAVCYPLHVQFVCTPRRTRMIILAIVVVVSLISLPRFFEYRKVPFEVARTGFQKTRLMTNAFYTVGYRIVFFFFLVYLIPLSFLVSMNVRIIRTLRTSSRQRFSVFRFHGGSSSTLEDSFSEAARSVTTVAVVIVTVSIACNAAVMASHLLYGVELCFASDNRLLVFFRRISSNLSNSIVTFDSAINFLIYCVFSRKFRATLREMFCPSRWNVQGRAAVHDGGDRNIKLTRRSTGISYT